MEQLITKSLQVRTADMVTCYYDKEKFLRYCRNCPNYNNKWSCPPFSFLPEDLIMKYHYTTVIMTKIVLDGNDVGSVKDKKHIDAYIKDIMSKSKKITEKRILQLEQNVEGSLALSSGGCLLCRKCSRPKGKHCKHQCNMRYSLEALGFDVASIVQGYFDTPMLWARDRLPKYFMLVNALMTN